jgi:hypothetical protein
MKISKLSVVILLALSLSACGGEGAETPNQDNTPIDDGSSGGDDGSTGGDDGSSGGDDGGDDGSSGEDDAELVDTASSFWFQISPRDGGAFLNNGRVMTDELPEGTMSSVENIYDNKLVQSVVWAGNDLNGDGIADSLSFDIVVEGFTGSTYSYSETANESEMTLLGTSVLATTINDSWGVDGDFDIDAGESLRFSIENISVSVANTNTIFEGFISFTASEPNGGNTHLMIVGEGNGLNGFAFSADIQKKELSSVDQVVVTAAGSAIDGRESAISSIAFKISVVNETVSANKSSDLSDYSEHSMGPLMGPAYPEQTDFSNFPEFSWDKIPRWLIVRNTEYYTNAEVQSFAENYDLIVWEKANKASFDSNEEGILDTAARVRAINPEVKNIYYFNTYVHYTGYLSDAEYEENAFDWSVRETDENGDEIIWMFKDLYYWHNPEVEAMRNWWIKTLADIADNDQIDGIFVDKVTETPYQPSAYDANGQPRTNYLAMLDGLDKALPDNKLYVGNTIRNERDYGGRLYMEFMDGTYLERWDFSNNNVIPSQSDAETMAVTIQMMREAAAKKKIVLYRTGEADATSEELMTSHVDWPIAIYLITADQYSYFAYQSSVNARDPLHRWDASWMDVFNKPLGAPSGEPEIDGFVYTRSFEHVDVWVNVETKETVIAWDSNDTDSDGMDDLWEYRKAGGLTSLDPSADPDGNDQTNLEEYQAENIDG